MTSAEDFADRRAAAWVNSVWRARNGQPFGSPRGPEPEPLLTDEPPQQIAA